MRYVIWGAGERGKRVFPHIGSEDVEAFIDKDETKVGTFYCGKKVISFAEYKENYRECYIVISYSFENEVVTELKECGISNYFLLSECPGEFQETNSRNLLKEYVVRYLVEREKYAIYGCTLYSMLLCKWIKQELKKEAVIIPHAGVNKELVESLKRDAVGIEFLLLKDVLAMDTVIEVLVTVEQDIEYLNRIVGKTAKLTNIYDCSDKIDAYYNPQIEKYRGRHIGKRCFIVATGPSLKINDLDKLAKNNEICISMNRIWYAFDKTVWRPEYYVVGDYRFLMEDEELLEELPVQHIFVADTYEPYWVNEHKESILKFHFHYEYLPSRMPKFSVDFSRKSYHGCSATYTCIQLAVYMGFSDIYLLGVDATRLGKYHDNSSHFCKEYISRSTTNLMTFDDEPRLAYKAAKEYADLHGIHIYNATRGGELETFQRVDFDELFD